MLTHNRHSKFLALCFWMMVGRTFSNVALAQSQPSGLTEEAVRLIINEQLQHYEKLLSAVSMLLSVTGFLLTIYIALQGIKQWRSWRQGRKYTKKLDEKYQEIISIRDQIDNARIAERNYRIAEEYRKEGRFPDAKRYYQEAIKYYPNDQDYFFNYGKVLIELCAFDEAIDNFKKAIQVFPQTLLFHQGLADCYEKTGKTDLAIKTWREMLESDNINPFYYKRLASLYRRIADYENALEYFEKCNSFSLDVDAIQGIIEVAIDLYARETKERNQVSAHRYLQKLIVTLDNLNHLYPTVFKVIFEDGVQRSPYFSELRSEPAFVEAFSFFWQKK